MADEHRARVFTANGIVRGAVLHDADAAADDAAGRDVRLTSG